MRAENLHKFLYEWDRGPFSARLRAGAGVPEQARMFRLGAGDVVLVDEAGMTGTFLLDRLVSLAAGRGAVVRLLDDDRQLPAVESGGALRLIAAQPGTPQLTTLYRFGNLAGRGDWIVTRLNDRRLSVFGGRDWVKNGDAWRVERRFPDGTLTVRHLSHGGRVTLPAAYVRDQVQLLYATTAHPAQGTTVDTAHPLITQGMTREALYVLATRARERTVLYVATQAHIRRPCQRAAARVPRRRCRAPLPPIFRNLSGSRAESC